MKQIPGEILVGEITKYQWRHFSNTILTYDWEFEWRCYSFLCLLSLPCKSQPGQPPFHRVCFSLVHESIWQRRRHTDCYSIPTLPRNIRSRWDMDSLFISTHCSVSLAHRFRGAAALFSTRYWMFCHHRDVSIYRRIRHTKCSFWEKHLHAVPNKRHYSD